MLFRSELVMVVHLTVPAKQREGIHRAAKSKPGELNYARPAGLELHRRRAVQKT